MIDGSRPGVSERETDEAKSAKTSGRLEPNLKPTAAVGKKRPGRAPAVQQQGLGAKGTANKVPPARQRLLDYMRELKRHVPACFNAMRWSPQQVYDYLLKTDSAEFAQKMLDEVWLC